MRGFIKQVAAYLTGWVIAQAFYNRVIRYWRDGDWAVEKNDIASRVADELESRRKSDAAHGGDWRLLEEGVPAIARRIYKEASLDLYSVDREEFASGCRAAFQSVVDDGNKVQAVT